MDESNSDIKNFLFKRNFNEEDLMMAIGLYVIDMNQIQYKVEKILDYVNNLEYSAARTKMRSSLILLRDSCSDNIDNIGREFCKRRDEE